MKPMKRLLVPVFFALAFSVFAQGLDITIEEHDGKITILRCRGAVKHLVIPAEIRIADGRELPITAIGDYAFAKKGIESVVIPDSVTAIGHGAFAENKIGELVLGDNITSVGRGAFRENRIKKVTIGAGLASISRGCFQVNLLSEVEIPANITAIGDYAFYSNRLEAITVPQSVAHIGEGAFASNYLAAITITDGVKKIDDGAFFNNELADITVPDGIEEVGKRAFNNKPKGSELSSRVNYLDTRDKLLYTTGTDFDAYFESQGRKAGKYVLSDVKDETTGETTRKWVLQ
jgi:hypothetical protein